MRHIIQLIYGVSNMWEYVKGSEADFEGAPEWCTQVLFDKRANERGFDEHWTGLQSPSSKFQWERTSEGEVFQCSSSANDDQWPVIAQRRKVDNLQSRLNDANLQQAFDTVQRPAHYNQSGIECIDAIAASMTPPEFQAYLKGNVQKYLWRYQHKNGLEDCRKAQWYLDRLVKELSK